jgi:flagellar hook-length control protein FliK
MNIDSIPSAKSLTSKSGLSGELDSVTKKETSSEGSDDSEGFFAKLSALFKGDAESSDKSTKSAKSLEGKEGDVSEAKVNLEAVKEESVDSQLLTDESALVDGEHDVDIDGSTSQVKRVDGEENLSKGLTDATLNTPVDSKKVMGDGDIILDKLKQANQVLAKANAEKQPISQWDNEETKPSVESDDISVSQSQMGHRVDGKELPLQNDSPVAPLSQDVVAIAGDNTTADNVEQVSDSDKITLSATDRFPESELLTQDDKQFAGLSQVSTDPSSEKAAVKIHERNNHDAPILAGVAGKNASAIEVPTADDIDPKVLEQLIHTLEQENNVDLSSLSKDDQIALVTTALVSAQQSQANLDSNVSEQGQHSMQTLETLTDVKGQPATPFPHSVKQVDSNHDLMDKMDKKVVIPGAGVAASLGAANAVNSVRGIPAAAETFQPDSETFKAVDGAVVQDGSMVKVGESKLSHQIQQAIQNQAQIQANANASQMVSERSAQVALNLANNAHDVATNSIVNSSVPAAAATAVAAMPFLNSSPDANSKAKWSNAHLEAIGRTALEADRAQQNRESHLSHQLSSLSSATGQQIPLNRTESAQPQVPIMMNKDIAADQLSERVQMMLSKNLKHVDIRLDPPELGRMHIRMNMNGDAATVHFTVASQHVRDALESSMPRLREMLSQQGVQLGETAVQQQGANQQQGYAASGRGQSQSGTLVSSENGILGENFDTDVKLDLNVGLKRDGISYYA